MTSEESGITHLYYRCYNGEVDVSFKQKTCVALSTDGVHFERPVANSASSKKDRGHEHNVVWEGIESHNFAPMIDTRPGVPMDEKYKAIGGMDPRAFPYRMKEEGKSCPNFCSI